MSINEDADTPLHVPEECRDDREIMKSTMRKTPYALVYASPTIKSDREIVRCAVETNGLCLQYANQSFASDYEIVKIAVSNHGMALQFAALPLRRNKEIVTLAVQNNGMALGFAADSENCCLRCAKDVISTAVRNNHCAYWHVHAPLRMTRWFRLYIVSVNAFVLQCLTREDQDDEEIVLRAVRVQGKTLYFASQRLKSKHSVVKAAVDQTRFALRYAILPFYEEKQFERVGPLQAFFLLGHFPEDLRLPDDLRRVVASHVENVVQ